MSSACDGKAAEEVDEDEGDTEDEDEDVTIVATRQGVSVATVYRARQRYLKTGSVDRAAGPIGWSPTQAPTLRKQSRSLVLRCTATRYKLLCARSLTRTPAPGTTRKTRPNKNVDYTQYFNVHIPHYNALQSSKKICTFCATMNINACLNYCNLDFIHSKNVQLCRSRGYRRRNRPTKFSKVQRTCTPPRRISFLGRIFFCLVLCRKKIVDLQSPFSRLIEAVALLDVLRLDY